MDRLLCRDFGYENIRCPAAIGGLKNARRRRVIGRSCTAGYRGVTRSLSADPDSRDNIVARSAQISGIKHRGRKKFSAVAFACGLGTPADWRLEVNNKSIVAAGIGALECIR